MSRRVEVERRHENGRAGHVSHDVENQDSISKKVLPPTVLFGDSSSAFRRIDEVRYSMILQKVKHQQGIGKLHL
jgi:hypothetical protein